MDVFALVAFSQEFDSIDLEGPHPFSEAFDRVQEIMLDRINNPFWKIGKWVRTASERELTEKCLFLRQYALTVVKTKQEKMERGEDHGTECLLGFNSTCCMHS